MGQEASVQEAPSKKASQGKKKKHQQQQPEQQQESAGAGEAAPSKPRARSDGPQAWPMPQPRERQQEQEDARGQTPNAKASGPQPWPSPQQQRQGEASIDVGVDPGGAAEDVRLGGPGVPATPSSTSPPRPGIGVLQVRILAAHSLVNKDTGLFGDVSDPYVVAKLGDKAFKTACIENSLNPVWTSGNEFSFPLTEGGGTLHLEVMNSNTFRDDTLGHTSVALWQLAPDRWHKRREKLEGVKTGELTFEVRFGPHEQARAAGTAGGASGRAEPELEYSFGRPSQQPRGYALPLNGVRVLELTRRLWSAALCGRMLAACGADVVRVAFGEESLKARQKMQGSKLDASAERQAVENARASTVPASLHSGKRLAPHHIEDAGERAQLCSALLPGCDVFLTDLPADELDSLQLGYRDLVGQFPGLIYAHASSIGTVADLSSRGVDDAGAFYSLTGFAEQLGHFLGPEGFAAATAASPLFATVCLAVMRRRCGCVGDRVELSVFRAGRWCTAVGALTGWERPPKPDFSFGRGADVVAGAPAGRPGAPPAFAPTATDVQRRARAERASPFPFGVDGVANISAAAAARTSAALQPWHLRWLPQAPGAAAPPPREDNALSSELPLARVSVIEMSDEYHISAAAVGSMLADLGARVTKLERPQRPDPWKRTCKKLYDDLNRKKLVQVVNYTHVGGQAGNHGCQQGQAAVYRTLADTTMLVTNLPSQALDMWGFGVSRLRTLFPHLIIVLISTWGCDEEARRREVEESQKGGQEIHAFWEASGLSTDCFGNLAMPPGLGELAISQHALAAIGLALLRQQRVGTGQFVHISRHHAGLFSRTIAMESPREPLSSPLLPMKDGRFMRLLGRGQSAHDAWVLLQAFGLRPSLWEKHKGNVDRVRKHLASTTEKDLRAQREELVAATPQMTFEEAAQRLRDAGAEWFVEEMRPVDAEELHRERAAKVEELRAAHQDAVEEALEQAEVSLKLEEAAQDAIVDDEELVQRLGQEEAMHRQELGELQRQWRMGVPPDVYVVMERGEAIQSRIKDSPDSYCVCEVLGGSGESRLQTRVSRGDAHPEWEIEPRKLEGYMLGGMLVFAVFARDHEEEEDKTQNDGKTGELILTICAAFNLKNLDTGIMGDVSDPYVVARLADQEFKTPTINDNLNPVWTEGNQFKFRLGMEDKILNLNVMNSNYVRDDSLGTCEVDISQLPREQRTRFKMRLIDGEGGELEIDAFLKPPHACQASHSLDQLVGKVDLPMDRFYPHGFIGRLPLYLHSPEPVAYVHVIVSVKPQKLLGPDPAQLQQQQAGWSGVPGMPGPCASGMPPQGGMPPQQNPGQGQPPMLSQWQGQGQHPSMQGQGSPQGMPTQWQGQGPPGMQSQWQGSGQWQGPGPPPPQLPGQQPGQTPDSSPLKSMMQFFGGLTESQAPQQQQQPMLPGTHGQPPPSMQSQWQGQGQPGQPPMQSQWQGQPPMQSQWQGQPPMQSQWQGQQPMQSQYQGQSPGGGPMGASSLGGYSGGPCGDSGAASPGGFMNGPYGPEPDFTPPISVLHVQVNGATGLKNKDTGLFGDVSDPYVRVKLGAVERKTPTINNNLNPEWTQGNYFQFTVSLEDTKLELDVMNENYGRDDSLGTVELDLRTMLTNEWVRYTERLREGEGAELLFDVFFKPTPHHAMVLERLTMLYVRVVEARDLKNLDTGVFGDVSDPYAKVRLGNMEFRTPTINNDLNPLWQDGNMFTFAVKNEDAALEIEVMNSNKIVKDDCLGHVTIELHRMKQEEWSRFEEKLVDGDGATVLVDAYLRPTPMRSKRDEVLRSRSKEAELAQTAKSLAQQVQEAEFSREWMEDVGGRTKLPMSLEERDWEQACGGRNLVIPTWITVARTQAVAIRLAKQQRPHAVALFPEAVPNTKAVKARVRIVGAEGLRSFSGAPTAYCVCEIPLKPQSQVTTPCAFGDCPQWRHSQKLRGYAPGDALMFKVYSTSDENSGHNGAQRPKAGKRDELVGEASLAGERFYPDGFDGLIKLTIMGRGTGASLHITASVFEAD